MNSDETNDYNDNGNHYHNDYRYLSKYDSRSTGFILLFLP